MTREAGVLIILVGAVLLVVLLPFLYLLCIWLKASSNNAPVTILNLLGMKLRKIPPSLIVDALIRLRRAGLNEVITDDLEAHYMDGGNVDAVCDALIAAHKAGSELGFQHAAANDLAGKPSR